MPRVHMNEARFYEKNDNTCKIRVEGAELQNARSPKLTTNSPGFYFVNERIVHVKADGTRMRVHAEIVGNPPAGGGAQIGQPAWDRFMAIVILGSRIRDPKIPFDEGDDELNPTDTPTVTMTVTDIDGVPSDPVPVWKE